MKAIRTINVAGTGFAEAEADLAVFKLTIRALTLTSSESLEQVNRRVALLKEALIKAGLRHDDIRSDHLEIDPQWERHQERRTFKGYEAIHRMTLQVDNRREILDPVYRAIFSAEQEVQAEVHFTLKDPGELCRLARQRAMEDAMNRSALYAQTAGLVIGKLISMHEKEAGSSMRNYDWDDRGMERIPYEDLAPGYDEVSFNPGLQKVSVKIIAEFSAEEKALSKNAGGQKNGLGAVRGKK